MHVSWYTCAHNSFGYIWRGLCTFSFYTKHQCLYQLKKQCMRIPLFHILPIGTFSLSTTINRSGGCAMLSHGEFKQFIPSFTAGVNICIYCPFEFWFLWLVCSNCPFFYQVSVFSLPPFGVLSIYCWAIQNAQWNTLAIHAIAIHAINAFAI